MACQRLFCALHLLILSPLCWGLTLDSVREFLTREEDSIVFSLIERAKYSYNAPAYDPSYLQFAGGHGDRSLVEIFVRETETVQAKAGRYRNPEEVPFFPNNRMLPLVPPYNFPQDLYPATKSVNLSQSIWNMYFSELLPLFTTKGDDGNYAPTTAADLTCLQALSRRIHYGRYVAEVKFKSAPQDYEAAIRAKDRNALMALVTNKSQEELVIRRVQKKAKVFGQDVTLDKNEATGTNETTGAKYKVDPSVVYRLYEDWVIPFTKVVEVEYLLRRLD